jgi:mono/diheme cytochrome c family protein
LPGKPNPADAPRKPQDILDVATLYKQNCAGCHGENGTLGPAPPLNDPIFLQIVPKDVLQNVIAKGRPGTEMPGFAKSQGGVLTDKQVAVLVNEIKVLFPTRPAGKDEFPPYEPPKGQEGAAARGLKLFARACAGCHGDKGQGKEKGAGANNNPAFLALTSDQALRRLIITGRPDLGMPSYKETKGRPKDFQPLTSDEIQDLVALLASWRTADTE